MQQWGGRLKTERQKRAIGGFVGQLLQAAHEDPQLSKDTQLNRMMEQTVTMLAD